jgi:Flp pilus assembly protein TadD
MKKIFITTASLIIAASILTGTIESAGVKDQMSFAAQMAKKGNWHEAIYRWQKALESQPENFRIHNNLAVAYEALGKYGEAEKAYRNALKYGKNNREVKENFNQFMAFYSKLKNDGKGPDEKEMDRSSSPAAADH